MVVGTQEGESLEEPDGLGTADLARLHEPAEQRGW